MREELPMRRRAEGFDFTFVNPAGHAFEYRGTVEFYPDGRIGEVFLSSIKSTSDGDIWARDAAILLSFALQHGATIESLQNAMTRGAHGEAHGVTGALIDFLLTKEKAA